jgi:hypothetical protein
MSQYQKECNRCGQKIKMSDELGTWKAFELEGKNIHECKPKRAQETKGHDLSIDVLLKRLDQLGISIDLSKLRLVK